MPSDLDASSDASIDAEIAVLASDAATPPPPAPTTTTTAPPVATSQPGVNLAGGGPPDCHFVHGGSLSDGVVFVVVSAVVAAVLRSRRLDRRRTS